MEFFVNFPLFTIILLLLSSAVTAVLRGRAARALTLSVSAAAAVLNGLVLWYGLRTGTVTEYMMGHYPHPWGNELRFGLLEPLFACVFSLVLFLSVLGGKTQLERDLHLGKRRYYYVFLDLELAALCALCYTNDLFTGYVFVEISTIAACGLLMIRELGRTTLASVRYMIFSLIGSGLFLLGVIFLYGITGHLLMPELREAVAALWESGEYRAPLVTAVCLMTLGLSVKSGLCPFHLWMPDTYGFSTPSSSAVLSGIVSKGYVVLFIKLIFDVFGTELFYASGLDDVVFVLGIAGMIVGSVSAMKEKQASRMIAYSSAAQIGYIFMGIGLSPEAGLTAAVFQILAHAFTKPMLFLSAAQLADASGGFYYRDLKNSAHRDRPAGAAFALGAFSMIGIPLTMGFVTKYLFAEAAFSGVGTFRAVACLIALAVSTVLNAFYFARTVLRVYRPEDDRPAERVSYEGRGAYLVSAVVFMLLNLGFGIAAEPLLALIRQGLALL